MADSVSRDAPQLLSVLKEMKDGLDAVGSKVQSLTTKVKDGKLSTSNGMSYLDAKYFLLLTYCQSLVYYILRKAKGLPIQGHPLIHSFVEIRLFLEKIRVIDKKNQYQIQKLTRAAERAAEKSYLSEHEKENEGNEDLLKYRPNPDMLRRKKDVISEDRQGLYKPLKFAPTMMEEEKSSRQERNATRREAESLRKMRQSEYMKELVDDIEGRPQEVRETVGAESRELIKYMSKLDNRARQEEELFTRVNISKKEKKMAKHLKTSRNGLMGLTDSLYDEFRPVLDGDKNIAATGNHAGYKSKKRKVTHSARGMELLKHFLYEVCGVSAGWKMEDVMDQEIKAVKALVGPKDHVICALSGGVDSTVAATLVHKAIGDRLHCVFVDNGLLRYKEKERVMEIFERELHLQVTCVDVGYKFLKELEGVVEPETKRKIIGKEFITTFDCFAKELELALGTRPLYLVQGTLYPDVIESCPPPGSGLSHSHTIKSHHNVGGLPKDMKLKLIEPLKLLFKDEVRALGKILGVPESFLKRHPFPGPGLAVRVLGDVTEGNALEILRQVDDIFVQSIIDAGIYDSIWQAFAVFLPVKSVGVQGDQRTHSHVVALRAVTSHDGMTADWYHFEHGFLDEVSRKICNNVRGVNRVVQDITSKPPATIEWE